MFAPKGAEAQTKAAASSTNNPGYQRSTLVPQRLGHRPVEQTHLFQPAIIGDLIGDERRDQHEQGGDPAADRTRMHALQAAAGASWDFGKIPVFAPARADQPEAPSRLAAPPTTGRYTAEANCGTGQ